MSITDGEIPRKFPRPRIDIGIKREVVRAIIAAKTEADAVKIVDRLWSMLRGDMQDRITSLLDTAWGVVEAKDMNSRRDGLKRALERLAPYEVAAARHIPRPEKKDKGGKKAPGRFRSGSRPPTRGPAHRPPA